MVAGGGQRQTKYATASDCPGRGLRHDLRCAHPSHRPEHRCRRVAEPRPARSADRDAAGPAQRLTPSARSAQTSELLDGVSVGPDGSLAGERAHRHPRRMRPAKVSAGFLLAVAAAAGALSACSSVPPAADEPTPLPDAGSPAAAYERTVDWGTGERARLAGTLRLVDGCLVVEGVDGAQVVPVFPTDFTWREGDSSLEGFGHAVTVDEDVVLGGGVTVRAGDIARLPKGCEGAQAYFMVHAI
jgi:hypothetical protein